MNTIERKKSVIGGYTDLETMHTLKRFPIFMGCVDHPQCNDLFADQTWDICKRTGVIQLKHLIPLDVLYSDQHCSVVGKLWYDHHVNFAQFINLVAPQVVLEIGGAHGTLSKLYSEIQNLASWTILEPNPAPAENVNARYIAGFFDSSFAPDCEYDAIVHSHVFEHMYEPDDFVHTLAGFGAGKVRHLFSVPNIKSWFRRKYTNAINFEHSVFITEEYIEYLLEKYGLHVNRKVYYGDDHSIFYDVIRAGDNISRRSPPNLYSEHKKIFVDYIDYHIKLTNSLNRQIENSEKGAYLFGAHVFSQYLIAFGLDVSKIHCIIDNNPLKHNHRLYGTNLIVRSPEVLRGLPSPMVIVKAGSHTTEIKTKIISDINPSTIFLE